MPVGKIINDTLVKSKGKRKKRPNSSDMRKIRKGSVNKLIDIDPILNESSTHHEFYDSIINSLS
jgi:hypothetical protein